MFSKNTSAKCSWISFGGSASSPSTNSLLSSFSCICSALGLLDPSSFVLDGARAQRSRSWPKASSAPRFFVADLDAGTDPGMAGLTTARWMPAASCSALGTTLMMRSSMRFRRLSSMAM